MSVIPLPAAPEHQTVKSQPGPSGPSISKNGGADTETQASFPAVFTQVNQQNQSQRQPALSGQGQANKTQPAGKPQGEPESVSAGNSEGTEIVQPLVVTPQPSVFQDTSLKVGGKAVPLPASQKSDGAIPLTIPSQTVLSKKPVSNDDGVPLAGGTKGEPTSSQTQDVVKIPELGETKPVLEAISSNTQKIASNPITLKTPVPAQVKQGNSIPVPAQVNQGNSIPVAAKVNQDISIPPLLVPKQVVPLSQGHLPPTPVIPTSFSGEGIPQGQTFAKPVATSNVSAVVQQQVQGMTSFSFLGTPSAAVPDVGTNVHQSSGSGIGLGDNSQAGDLLGQEQQTSQENGQAFSGKSNSLIHTLGASPVAGGSGPEFRVSDSPTADHPEGMAERSRTLTALSPHRMQMEVMLSDDTKVHLDVAVKQQQVTAQLMTDQWFIRNLALQQEPQLDTQLSSVGLELKQFGAEVDEHGLFGQHLGGSSSQHFGGNRGEESPSQETANVFVGAGVEADGRLHYVA